MTRGTCCRKNGGLADQWYMDDGDTMCHPILVLPLLQDFDVANARVGAERDPLKTAVIYCVNDMDVAPPEWRIGDVRSMLEDVEMTAVLIQPASERTYEVFYLLVHADNKYIKEELGTS